MRRDLSSKINMIFERFESLRLRQHPICVRPGHTGNILYLRRGRQPRAERVVERLQGFLLQVEVSKITVHEACEPNAVVDFFAAARLSGRDQCPDTLFALGWRSGQVAAVTVDRMTIGPRDSVVCQPGDQLGHHHSGSWMNIVKKNKTAAPKQHQ
jgi:hypothetical protein